MPASLDSFGDIEVITDVSKLGPNKQAKLVFRVHAGTDPPYQIVITSPTGKIILKRVLRELPTGEPQSPAPITFMVQEGDYKIEVAQIKGDDRGEATLTITA